MIFFELNKHLLVTEKSSQKFAEIMVSIHNRKKLLIVVQQQTRAICDQITNYDHNTDIK